MIYYDIVIWVVKLLKVYSMLIVMIFNMSISTKVTTLIHTSPKSEICTKKLWFSQNFISLFSGLFNDETDPRVVYFIFFNLTH
jgi:hypothetical protein